MHYSSVTHRIKKFVFSHLFSVFYCYNEKNHPALHLPKLTLPHIVTENVAFNRLLTINDILFVENLLIKIIIINQFVSPYKERNAHY